MSRHDMHRNPLANEPMVEPGEATIGDNYPSAAPVPVPATEIAPPEDGEHAQETEYKGAITARLFTNVTLYHQDDGQPTSFERKNSRILSSREQPYTRKTRIGATFKQLDMGWLNGMADVVMLSNEEGKQLTNPTPEQKQESERKALVVAVLHGVEGKRTQHDPPPQIVPFTVVPAGETIKIHLIGGLKYYIRSNFGELNYVLVACPA